jgi:TonB family protein
MRRISVFVGFFLLLLPLAVTAQTPNTSWYNNTARDFTISTADQLAGLAVIVNGMWDETPTRDNFAGKTITLSANIDLSAYQNWEPIGDRSVNPNNVFAGTFNGNGKIIRNLTINRSSTDFQGLFGIINSGKVENLGLNGVNISGNRFVGGIVGYINNGVVVSSYSNGTVNGLTSVGGIVGSINAGGIANSHSSGIVRSRDGRALNGALTWRAGERPTGNGVGGIAGDANRSSVTNSHSTATVSGTNSAVGGIVGYLNRESNIKNCYFKGEISGINSHRPMGIENLSHMAIGGVVGVAIRTSIVANSYSIGTINGTHDDGIRNADIHTGGIAGAVLIGSTVTNCYSTAALSGNAGSIGGVAGWVSNGGNLTNNYFAGTIIGSGQRAGGVAGIVLRTSVIEFSGGGIRVTDNAALNPAIKNDAREVGRVVGFNRGGLLSNNAAYSEMTNSAGDKRWANRGANELDGVGIASLTVNTDGTVGGRFINANGWTVQDGSLPGIGSPVVIPQQPREEPRPPAPRQERVNRPVEEDLSQLADILTALPAPVPVRHRARAACGTSYQYLVGVQRKIEQSFRPTMENPRQSAVVRFTIQRDGTVTNTSIETSSGDRVFDNQAVRAVLQASPFNPLPPGIFLGNSLETMATLSPNQVTVWK